MRSYGDLNSFSYMGNEPGPAGYFPAGTQQIMAVTNLLEQNVPENTISEEKGQEIFDFIRDRFKEKDHKGSEMDDCSAPDAKSRGEGICN